MLIENSPYSPANSNSKKSLNPLNSNKVKPTNEQKESDFSFWNWIKSTVNPLQNLPIISGIYSSLNSDDKNSDRDMIQNSLGGFIYGGPFGALAGFGNWVFNKIFEKTPAELALDLSGISKIWKDGDSGENIHKKNMKEDNSVSPMLVSLNPIKTNEKVNDILSTKNDSTQVKSHNKIALTNFNLKNVENTKIKSGSRIDKLNDTVLNEKILEKPLQTVPIISLKPSTLNLPEDSVKIEKTYKNLNFSYPEWNSENTINLNKSKLKSYDFNDKDNIEKKYLNIDA